MWAQHIIGNRRLSPNDRQLELGIDNWRWVNRIDDIGWVRRKVSVYARIHITDGNIVAHQIGCDLNRHLVNLAGLIIEILLAQIAPWNSENQFVQDAKWQVLG